MIINLQSKNDENGIQLNMPNLSLNRKIKYKIGVRRLFCLFEDSRQDLPAHDLVVVRSNLVERSAENPDQAIIHVDFSRKSKYVTFCPSLITYQPLRLYELSGSSFELSLLDGTVLNSKRFFIQIEILRDDSYGWF